MAFGERRGRELAVTLTAGRPAHPATPTSPAPVPPPRPVLEVAEQCAPQRGRHYPRERVAPVPVPVVRRVDVLVVGGGSSGAPAAISAAREGATTLVVDAGPGLGGTGTYGGVHSYWFGRREGQAAELQRRTRGLHREHGLPGGVGNWHIELKALALGRAAAEAGVEVLPGTLAVAALRTGDRVRGAVLAGPEGPVAVVAEVVVDATGDADLAAWCGAPTEYGAVGTHTVMWSSLARFEHPGVTRNTFGGIADVSNVEDSTRAVLAARRRGGPAHDHGIQPAARESRHLVGEATVTLTDQLTQRHWPDVVNLHFSNHDVKGKGEALWPQLGLIPPNLEVELPYRALLPRGLDGLLVTGKALSATHDALAALRMQADLENLGAVTGAAAARCALEGVAPRALDVPRLQRVLVERGLLPARALRRPAPVPPPVPELVAELVRRVPLHAYSDMGRRETYRGAIPLVHLVLDPGPRVTDALLTALDQATGPGRLVLAQALVCRGASAGVEVLLERLHLAVSGPALPAREARIREAQLPPDQSAMPQDAYLLYTLALARDPRAVAVWERVAELVDVSPRGLRDPLAGSFYWVDAVCAGAERLGDPAAVPLLLRLRERPGLHAQWRHHGIEPDDFQERAALLELALGRALARCGSAHGTEVLVEYLDDCRALLAEQAHRQLVAVYGVDLGKDAAAWLRRLADGGPATARPLPWEQDPHAADLPFPVGMRPVPNRIG
ncbi:hypothetical protein AQ490_15085 [Wenjunlia vitaminophila]|uniref:FAD-dependent oxidoreductase n=1 Tax=Wenjunlia vitaminophila TaxID=76728 RepID=A0A0T6LWB8_WENVI|nr:hypothetical protein AQ490_15085 [Wenjunlia vitaminophila]